MAGITVTRRKVWEGSDPEPLARVVGRDEGVLLQADFAHTADLEVGIFEIGVTTAQFTNSVASIIAGHPDGSDIIFDTLQTDGRWKADTTGYNFRYSLRDDDLTGFSFEGGKSYRIEFLLDTIGWGVIPVVFEYEIVPLYTT